MRNETLDVSKEVVNIEFEIVLPSVRLFTSQSLKTPKLIKFFEFLKRRKK